MYYQSRTYLKSFKNTLFILVQVSVFWIESSLKSNLYPKENQAGQSYPDLFELPFPWSHFWVWGHPGCTLWTEKKNQTCKKFNLGLPKFNKKNMLNIVKDAFPEVPAFLRGTHRLITCHTICTEILQLKLKAA